MPSYPMRSAAWAAVLATVAVVALAAPEAPVPIPQGFVTDLARVIPPDTEARITRFLEELRQKTGAEIAVVTVESTDPLDDFTYALRIADAWKPGHKGEDTGIVFLVAVRDRKLRILTGRSRIARSCQRSTPATWTTASGAASSRWPRASRRHAASS